MFPTASPGIPALIPVPSALAATLPAASRPDVLGKDEAAIEPAHEPAAERLATADELSGGELFDGSARIPTVATALSRRTERGLSMEGVARAIEGSSGLAQVGGRLAGLGLLKPAEVGSTYPDMPTHLETLVEGLWRETSPALDLDRGVERNWAVPALVVTRSRTTFYVHPLAHGWIRPDNRGAVLRLIEQITASGGILYSEQNLPGVYGYRNGREFLDHTVADGKPAAVRGAAKGTSIQRLDRALTVLLSLGALAWTASGVWAAPSDPAAWGLFAAAAAFLWLLSRAFKPLLRARRLLRAAQLRSTGDADGAAWYMADAAAFYGRLIDPAVLRRLRLPMPLGLSSDRLSKRSLAMADAAAADAATLGAQKVHVLTGYEHSLEIAWRLENSDAKTYSPGPI
jgi:hypothetical protein